MVPLITGFGLQVSLYTYSKHYVWSSSHGSASVGASGGVSTASMIACCAHHLTDVFSLVGLTAAAVLLAAYQQVFLVLGLLSNLIGITVIMTIMQKHRLYNPDGRLARIMGINMATVRNLVVLGSLAIMIPLGWATFTANTAETSGASNVLTLDTKVDNRNGLTVEVTPLPFSPNKDVVFNVRLDTHTGSLSFDLTKTSYLEDGTGRIYVPKSWNGSPLGGHHGEGTLYFEQLPSKPAFIRLVLRNLYGVDSRVFEWSLPKPQ